MNGGVIPHHQQTAYDRGYQNGQATLEARCKRAYGRGLETGIIGTLTVVVVILSILVFGALR